MSKPRKICIFCGNTGMSKEHIWGKWLKDYVRQDLLKHGMFTQVVNRPGTPNTEHLRIKSGDPLQSKVRVVCMKCNNEWLSVIQDRTKPHLIPLFTGTTRVLGAEAQESLATWITMATMTAEHLVGDPRQRAISQADREFLWRNGKPPAEWRILIGRYQRHHLAAQWTHWDIPVVEPNDAPGGRSAAVQHADYDFYDWRVFRTCNVSGVSEPCSRLGLQNMAACARATLSDMADQGNRDGLAHANHEHDRPRCL